MRWQEISEASRYATVAPEHIASREPTPVGQYLFHGTPLTHALAILMDNDISTGIDWRGEGARVALTRSYRVAKGFGQAGDYDCWPVVLVLDWAKLVRDYKVVPHQDVDAEGNFWKHPDSEDGTEQEEAVYGHIKPLSKYLVSINIDPQHLEEALEDDDHANWSIEEKGFFRTPRGYRNAVKRLMQHPKLNVWTP